jgi:hypothetical protein
MFSRYKISSVTTNPYLEMILKTSSTTPPIIISLPAHAHKIFPSLTALNLPLSYLLLTSLTFAQ